MPIRNVVLTNHQAALIERLVTSGCYQNASEVLREGLRLLETRDAEDAAKLAALRAAVQVGIDDMEAGRYRTFESRETIRDYMRNLADAAIARGAQRTGAE